MTLVFKKHNGPTPADDITPQIITDCGNLTLDFKQLGLWASPPFLQTLGPWFPNEIQNLLSSEKRTLDHCATFQFFVSLAQVRCLWRQMKPNSLTRLCVVALDTLTPASVHSLWSSTKFLNRFCLTILIRLRFLSVGCASFSSTLFPSTQLSVNMLGYSTLWIASFYGNEYLWLTLLVKQLNDCLLDNCQISSLPHDCVT